MAWTENPRDEQASRLREGRRKALALLEKAYSAFVTRGSDRTVPDSEQPDSDTKKKRATPLEGLRSVMAFAGVGPNALAVTADGTTSGILEYSKGKADKVRYLAPSCDVFALAGVPV